MAWILSVLTVAAWLGVFVITPTVIIFRLHPDKDLDSKVWASFTTVILLHVAVIILGVMLAIAYSIINPYFN
ncbi:hypothetical protein [Bifidobacterium tissieri]|uniref:Uncharacterized protein n=1 Tax=Bifidobacterium tissieri TaxID=1630162 RepID=A0A5M9ZMH1_9BIFI|nr:hypothetical protein [Bifidobacterium tissieri]KAA8828678.1 hypothetical protein EM849_11615 [Bifidobacterium tissieri]KAA8831621.1 hypothetical protein EMO89_02530 [Bifidobacterium tissieri]